MPDDTTTQQNDKQKTEQSSSNTPLADLSGGNVQNVLQNLAKGAHGGVGKVVKFITEGHKLDNGAMMELLIKLRQEEGMSYRDLLSLYLTLDKAVEDGILDQDLLEFVEKNNLTESL
jgi:hypothetical protein